MQSHKDKVSKQQHGFVKHKSCLTNLLETFDSIIDLIDEGVPVDVLYFDFRKAFDRVPHNRLLLKLENLGISGKVLNVIKDFLRDRSFRVSVEGNLSSLKNVLSGIPQGSVLGPLLFILFINDLPESVKSIVKLFADDLKLIADGSDKSTVDNDLKILEAWQRSWLLEFNSDKCKVLHLNFNNNNHKEYFLNDIALKKIDREKDLGVLTSSSLLWTEQIEACVSKANQMICWIARNVISREKTLMLRVYKSIIRPHLEYCVQLWNPATEHGNWALILKIEGVQRRYTRLIEGIGLLPYSERLVTLGLTTLAERRLRGDLIETFKAGNGFSEVTDVFKFSRSGMNLVCKPRVSKDANVKRISRNFINERVIKYWNNLPLEARNAETVNEFKIKLENYKKQCLKSSISDCNHFWDVSKEVLGRIENENYLENKLEHNIFLKENPIVAKKKFINIY